MDDHWEEVKFVADRMLGKLVKWLRVIGEDVIYGSHLSGYGLIRAARRENRVILPGPRLEEKTTARIYFHRKRSLCGSASTGHRNLSSKAVEETLYALSRLQHAVAAESQRVGGKNRPSLCLFEPAEIPLVL